MALASVSLGVQSELSRSLAKIRSQKEMRTPIAVEAYRDARDERDHALDSFMKIIDELELVAAEAHAMDYSVEEWCALFELGGILQTLGVTLTRFAEDPTAKKTYLVRAMGVFRRAVETVRDVNSEQDAEMIAKAAFAGRSLAQLLKDAAMEDFFSESIQRVVSNGLHSDTIDRQKASEKHSILNMLHCHHLSTRSRKSHCGS
jgi:hypothetical protein